MNITVARLRIWNNDAYSIYEVREAAVFILACFEATQEDIDRALALV